MIDDIFKAPLPKGMRPPISEVEQAESYDVKGQTVITSSDVNYVKLIRDALTGIDGIDIDIVSLLADEKGMEHPIVSLELVVMPKGR